MRRDLSEAWSVDGYCGYCEAPTRAEAQCDPRSVRSVKVKSSEAVSQVTTYGRMQGVVVMPCFQMG